MTGKREATQLIMIEPIAKHLFSDSYGAFDRFLEIGVFLLIAYEVGVGIWRGYREHQRTVTIEERVAKLRFALAQGQKILSQSPRGAQTNVDLWAKEAAEWIGATCALLVSYSPQAETAFAQEVDAGQILNYPYYTRCPNEHHALLTRLNNLKGIIEKPEIYF